LLALDSFEVTLDSFVKIAEWKLKSKLDIALDGVEDVNKDNLKLTLLSHSLSTQLSLIHAPPPEDNKTILNTTVAAKEKDAKLNGTRSHLRLCVVYAVGPNSLLSLQASGVSLSTTRRSGPCRWC
jgi:hypothetical protein